MTSKTDRPAPDVRIHVRFEASPNYTFGTRYAHVYAIPVILAPDKYAAAGRRWDAHDPDSYSVDTNDAVRALAGLHVDAQADNHGDPDNGARNRDFYGWEVTWQPSRHPQLHDIERVLPVLRRTDKRMTALREQFGYPRDLTGYLAHFATALLPRQPRPFIRRVNEDEQDIEGTGYRSMDAENLRYWLESSLRKWREQAGVSTER